MCRSTETLKRMMCGLDSKQPTDSLTAVGLKYVQRPVIGTHSELDGCLSAINTGILIILPFLNK